MSKFASRAPETDAFGASDGDHRNPEARREDDDSRRPIRCPYCDRPFRTRRLRTLHAGLEHPERLTDDQREAFESASREDDAAIRRFRVKALGMVVLSYFSFLFVYAVVT
ncbi:C2H2-type zinc finger protein [Natrialbaceae archaeon GCM10025810]